MVAELHGTYNIQSLAFDRWRIEDIQRELAAIGCDVPLVPFGQGFKDISPAVDYLERLVEGAPASARDAPGSDHGGREREGGERRGGQ